MNYGFLIDNRKCIGCHACTVACKSEHDIPVGVNRTHVKYVEKGVFPHTGRSFTVTRCNHCRDAPCVEICPTSALFTRRDGIVDFSSDRCIGCKSCMQACPYDALYIDPATQTAAKCNYCAHRIEKGYEPSCVVVCPVEAIVSGDLNDPGTHIAGLVAGEDVSVRKPEKETLPNLFYVDGDPLALDPSQSAPLTSYLFTDQSGGVGHFAEQDSPGAVPGRDLFPPLSQDADLPTRGGVTLAGGIGVSTRAIDDVGREIEAQGSRVYDAPHKGVLWGWEVSAYIWTKAIASGTFIVLFLSGLLLDQPDVWTEMKSLLVSMAFLALTGLFLIVDLDRPDRFLYVLLRPNWKSWLVRGAYIVTAFSGLLGIALFALASGWEAAKTVAMWTAFPLSLLCAVYTAFLFAQARGRDLWQTRMSVLRMLNQAVLAGMAVMMVLEPGLVVALRVPLALSVGLNLLLVLADALMPHSSHDAALAASMMRRGYYAILYGVGIVAGSLLPLAVLLLVPGFQLVPAAAVAALVGVYLTEFVWVRVPQLVPLS